MKQYTYIANWKMNMPFNMAQDFCKQHNNELHQLSSTHDAHFILCGSFPALASMSHELNETSVDIGAQNCSAHTDGAFTGEVDALSLQQAGCSHVIAGHSERRHIFGESSQVVAQKVARIYEQYMTPIACIGETVEQYNQNETYAALEQQLAPVVPVLQEYNTHKIYIAYEPAWSIGSGNIPNAKYLNDVYTWIQNYLSDINTPVHYVYGGSISPENIRVFKNVDLIDGFLIGGASLDFQKLKNIVEYTT